MKFTCSRQALQSALGVLGSVIPSHSVKPILQNICFEPAGENQLSLSATDLDVGVKYLLEVENLSEPVSLALPAQRLNGIVRTVWGDKLSFDIKDYKATIGADRSSFRVPGEPGDEFPQIASLNEEEAMEVRAEDLARAIQQTIFATARDESRYTLAGIFMQANKNSLELAATDTYRLTVAKRKLRGNGGQSTAIVIAKGMQELAKLLDGEELVKFQITETQLLVKTSKASLASHLIEGQFPRYGDIIPKGNDRKVKVKREEFLQALNQAALVANELTHGVRLIVEAGKMRIQASSEKGDADITLEAEIEGAEVAANFNYTYLTEVLKVLTEETVTFQLKDNSSPGKIETDDYIYVVSPIYPKAGQ